MGEGMIQKVLTILRDGGIRADGAYPGQKCPVIVFAK